MREAILRLNDQERTVLSLYYFEELKSARHRRGPRHQRVPSVADPLEGAEPAAHRALADARVGVTANGD